MRNLIQIRIIDRGNEEVEIRIRGHADYSPRGSDIVCSAVSALYISLCKSTKGKEDVFGDERRLIVKKGGELNMAICGFDLIAKDYPENVTLEK